MRNKKSFSFDEERDAEEVILNGFPGGAIDYSKMYLVAKYFRHNFNYGAIRLERELIKFCYTQDKNFNPVVDAESIKKWIRSAMNYGLRKIDSVTITQKEIDFLKNIETPKDRKLLFITLVLAKAFKKRSTRIKTGELKTSDNYYIRYNNFLDIIRLSKLKNISEVELANVFHKYKDNLTFYNAGRELIRIDYIDKNTENGILIDDMDKVLEFYDLFFGKSSTRSICSVCGKEMIKTNNNQKRCKECSKIVRNEKQKELMRKRRNSLALQNESLIQ